LTKSIPHPSQSKEENMNNSEVLGEIQSLLDDLSLYDQVEICANLLVSLGYNGIQIEADTKPQVDPVSVVDAVMNDLERNGENLPNSLARQGLVMLSWLED